MTSNDPKAGTTTPEAPRSGPLTGINVVEFAGKGPTPFAGMMLSDMGASVLRIERVGDAGKPSRDLVVRGRRSLAVDLKMAEGREIVRRIVNQSDVLLEGFRPGVMERLGFGPDECLESNSDLIYGRMTGWGQGGPYALKAGHDINYIALSGALGLMGRSGQAPTPPLNLVGDLGGGGCLLAFGVLCALVARSRGASGQVIDASMVEGSALLLTMLFDSPWIDSWGPRGTNMLDSGAPFYDAYQTSDRKWLAVGAIEPEFYENFVTGLGIDPKELHPQMDKSKWPYMKEVVARRIGEESLARWLEIFSELDACIAPVLDLAGATTHPQNVARGVFVPVGGTTQPAPTPRFSVTAASLPGAPPVIGAHTIEELRERGYSDIEIAGFRARKVVAQA